jgi:hypothetical protein
MIVSEQEILNTNFMMHILLLVQSGYRNKRIFVRFEVSTALTMMVIIFWEMIIIKRIFVSGRKKRNCPQNDGYGHLAKQEIPVK